MKLSYTFSQLSPLTQLNRAHRASASRSGVLFRGEGEKGVGYFEYFPWQSFGDVDERTFLCLMQQKDSSTRKRVEALIEIVAAFLQHPQEVSFNNHQLIYPHTELSEIHSPVVKMKYLGSISDLTEAIYRIHSSVKKIRIDFNFALNLQELIDFISSIEGISSVIDYIEDPIPYSEEDYSLLQGWKELIRIDLPFNRDGKDCGLDRIYKPTINPIPLTEINRDDIFSSYMGHPIGKILCLALLLRYGSTDLFHGIDTPIAYENEQALFSRNLGTLTLIPSKLNALLDELEGLEWISF